MCVCSARSYLHSGVIRRLLRRFGPFEFGAIERVVPLDVGRRRIRPISERDANTTAIFLLPHLLLNERRRI